MFITFIKYSFIFVCSYIFYTKLLNQKSENSYFFITFKKKELAFFVQAISLLIVNFLLFGIRIFIPQLTVLFLFILLFVYTSLIYNISAKISIVASAFSVGFSYSMFIISTIICSPISIIIQNTSITTEIMKTIFTPIICITQILLTILIFKIKRLRNGMPFLREKISNKIGIYISCFVLFISSLFTILDNKNRNYTLLVFFCTFMCFILFIWWRKQLTISYINRNHKNEILSLEAEIKRLKLDNEQMATLIHKDNKLIPAMIMSLENLLTKACDNNISSHTLSKDATNILNELKVLSSERTGTLNSNSPRKLLFNSTNLIRLDSVIEYMYQKSISENISFNVSINADIETLIRKTISEDALVTLIADLTENAIIATRQNDNEKHILLNIVNTNNTYCIEIYDNGSLFSPHVIRNAGKRPTTTHLDTGGSGIGLMTTFALLRESFASFVIDETISDSRYSKSVSIVFDYKNEFRVYSKRYEITELQNECPEINIIS